jgi:hypothetical protein
MLPKYSAALLLLASAVPFWAPATADKQPVLVELFTSEGCSSCPPADSLLKQISEQQPFDGIEVIALEEHVDYWNHDGWTDPFSSSDFTRRQQDYATYLPGSSVYTPQMIVDGHAQFVGSHTQEAQDQILSAASHPKPRLALKQTDSAKPHSCSFELSLDPFSAPPSSSPLELWVAIAEKGLHSDVTAGENSGSSLYHAPIVRQLRKFHSVNFPLNAPATFSLKLNDNWSPANLSVVAFLVDSHSHQVVSAVSSPLSH